MGSNKVYMLLCLSFLFLYSLYFDLRRGLAESGSQQQGKLRRPVPNLQNHSMKDFGEPLGLEIHSPAVDSHKLEAPLVDSRVCRVLCPLHGRLHSHKDSA